jgi:hypothetical protein
MTHHGLKLLDALCRSRPDFALDLAAAAICAFVTPVLLQNPERRPDVMAFDLLMAVGCTCELGGIDLRTIPGFGDAAALARIELNGLPDDAARVKITEFQARLYDDDARRTGPRPGRSRPTFKSRQTDSIASPTISCRKRDFRG